MAPPIIIILTQEQQQQLFTTYTTITQTISTKLVCLMLFVFVLDVLSFGRPSNVKELVSFPLFALGDSLPISSFGNMFLSFMCVLCALHWRTFVFLSFGPSFIFHFYYYYLYI